MLPSVRGDIASAQVLDAARGLVERVPYTQVRLSRPPDSQYGEQLGARSSGNLHTHMAGCCKPLPGDAIMGYITQSRGVSIHRADCARVLKLQAGAAGRIMEVEWDPEPGEHYEVDVAIVAIDRQGLLRDVTGLLANARINVLSINTQTHRATNTAMMRLRLEVPDISSLSKLLERIDRQDNVLSVERVLE